jgi:hexosaminidase
MVTMLCFIAAAASIPDENSIVWPQPQSQTLGARSGYVSANLAFLHAKNSTASGSSLLAAAFDRSTGVIFQHRPEQMSWIGRCDAAPCPLSPPPPDRSLVIRVLVVSVAHADESLTLGTSENYTLSISFPNASLTADSVFGAMRGLETFSQLVQPDYSIREQSIVDFPRFPFRAVLIDTARHFLPVPLIMAHLDAMSYNKMNVLHWHIVDMPSFPFVSTTFPHLAADGAFDSNHTYSPSEVARVVKHARQRGIHVVPEFDMPAHTFPSWDRAGVLHGNSTLLTKCSAYAAVGGYGPLRADLETTYIFIEKLLVEAAAAFPDAIFNIGGDEVSSYCYEENADVAAYLRAHNMTGGDLVAAFASRVLGIVRKVLHRTPMMWWPGTANLLPPVEIRGSVLDIYLDSTQGYNGTATNMTRAGVTVVRSGGYYLDQLCPVDPDGKHHGTYWGYWQGWSYYNVDPVVGEIDMAAGGRPELVIGGKANMWGEHVDATNFFQRVWPRASVMAERFWSAASVNVSAAARPRLHEFRCKMVRRGILAEPIASLMYNEGGPYHTAYCAHDSDGFAYAPPVPWWSSASPPERDATVTARHAYGYQHKTS